MKIFNCIKKLILGVILTASTSFAQSTITTAFSDFGNGNINAFELGGSASLIGSELQLTPAVNNLYGTAYYKNKVSLADNRSFSAHFSFKMTNPTCFVGLGADGIGFVIQQTSNTAGSAGGGLGYAGVSPSFTIEFDTFDNASTPIAEPDNNHIGINIDGDTNSVASATPSFTLNDGNTYFAWVDYNGATDQVEVRYSSTNTRPASADISYTVDLASNLSSDVYVGFSAATGGCNETHEILSFYFNNGFISGGIIPGTETYTSAPTSVVLDASLSSIAGNGVESSVITATVKNVDGTFAAGKTVTFTTDSGTLSAASAVTDANGKATVNFKSTTAGTPTIRGTVTGGAFGNQVITVTFSPTPVPTSTPTVPTNKIEGIVTSGGQPVVKALVYIPGVGTALTDENGKFVFENVSFTGTLQAFVQRTGVEFSQESYPVTTGQFVQVSGTPKTFNPQNCDENDISAKLHEIAGRARDLLDQATEETEKLPLKFDLTNGQTTRKKALKKLTKQFELYLLNSRKVPEVILDCSNVCTETSHNRSLKRMTIGLDNLKRGTLFATRLLDGFDKMSPEKKDRLQKRVRRISKAALKTLKRLPKKSFSC